jgi:hydroxylamine reductase
MFCYQCEQTLGGSGCLKTGVCGKDETTSYVQDLLTHAAISSALVARAARLASRPDQGLHRGIIEALFKTVTNVNFDPEVLAQDVWDLLALREAALSKAGLNPDAMPKLAQWKPNGKTATEMAAEAPALGIKAQEAHWGVDRNGLRQTILYGLKGAAAYADHAQVLGFESDAVYEQFLDLLTLIHESDTNLDALVAGALQVGKLNFEVMELLDRAHTTRFGNPTPTAVRIEPLAGKAILISGHDLLDLELLLQQTSGKNINVYTHGEMLPAHGYPHLKKYPHLAGNYGGAWQDQQKEFATFPGAILMTTNCIQAPRESYRKRIFTTGLVRWPGVEHCADKNFAPVIAAALNASGFAAAGADKTILTGFGHNAVLQVAGKVVSAVKQGKIKHFFLIGGCDGAKPGRNYYTELAEQVPQDSMILTLACGKFRFNKLDFGQIDGLPRLLDIGQCNDAYSAIKIALALSEAFGVGVNALPLSIILSWYEQKAVAILLTLLHLGIKNIQIGPSLPAFITPAVLKVLVDAYGLAPISTPEKDLARRLVAV